MQPRPELLALTGARFFAAAAVVAFHFLRDKGPEPQGIAAKLVARGYVGVSFFFVLSGFVLTYNYGPALASGTARLGQYALARFARIYPMYLLSLALGFVAAYPWLSKQPMTVDTVLRDAQVILLLNSLHHRGMFHLNWAAWSLSVEVAFYASLPWLLGSLRRQRPAQLLAIATGCYAGTLLATVLFNHVDPDQLGHPLLPSDNGRYGAYFKFFPLFHAHAFLWGVAAALWLQRWSYRLSRVTRPARELSVFALLCAVAALLVWLPTSAYLALNDGLLAPLWACLLLLLAGPHTLLSRCLSMPPLHWLGRTSYAIYILHVPLYLVLRDYFGWGHVAYIASLIGVASFAFAYVEEPSRKWLKSLGQSQRRAHAA